MHTTGCFVVSLDFELMWGVRDVATKQSYGLNIVGVHTALPKILDLFKKYQIRGTFATVGLLFCKNKDEILSHIPIVKPGYENLQLSPYHHYLQEVGNNIETDRYHYGWPLLEMIQKTTEHEISTHTFSHYYCLEEGQTAEAFESDLTSALTIAQKRNIVLSSIVFPRNQINETYLAICAKMGIQCYRGNEYSWLYQPRNGKQETLWRRMFRLIDSYINISGHHCYSDRLMASSFPYNLPSSRFLRPYSKKLILFDFLKLRRITRSMTHAAKNNKTYHLWWHPHNFGINQAQNLQFLEKILKHYQYLQAKYGFRSVTMSEKAIEITQTFPYSIT